MMIEQGWQCPICKRVYNPRQEMCLYCGHNSQQYTYGITLPSKTQETGISWTNSYDSCAVTATSACSASNSTLNTKENTNATTVRATTH